VQARKQVAAMIAALEGVDLIVFTGGIGEHDEQVREEICDGLSWFGVGSVRVFTSQEDEQIARHTWELLSGAS
jgi:acetate kinase